MDGGVLGPNPVGNRALAQACDTNTQWVDPVLSDVYPGGRAVVTPHARPFGAWVGGEQGVSQYVFLAQQRHEEASGGFMGGV
jgi:hypothetical protein